MLLGCVLPSLGAQTVLCVLCESGVVLDVCVCASRTICLGATVTTLPRKQREDWDGGSARVSLGCSPSVRCFLDTVAYLAGCLFSCCGLACASTQCCGGAEVSVWCCTFCVLRVTTAVAYDSSLLAQIGTFWSSSTGELFGFRRTQES